MSGVAEIVFETGSRSLFNYDDESEVSSFVKEHTRRAMAGEAGGPTGHPAERVSKVYFYSEHPSEEGSLVSAENVKALVDGMAKNGRLDGNQLMAAIRDEMSPTYPMDQGRHASQYKMKEDKVMTADELLGGE